METTHPVVALRDYQQAAHDAAMEAMRAHGSALIVMATGLGKTVVFAEIIRSWVQRTPCRVLVLAHREELIVQAARTIKRMTGLEVGIEMGASRVDDSYLRRPQVVVSTVQTQVAGRTDRKRMVRFDPKQFGLVIVDEAHHAVADSYRAVVAHYQQNPNCRVLGVTATPDRTDEAALGEMFARCAYEFGIREGVEAGWLVGIKQRTVHVEGLDFSGCRTTAGDLNGADLDAVLRYEETLHGMVYPTINIVGDRRCIVFAASVAHAHRIAEILNRHRPACAVAVDGKTDRDVRRERFAGFAEGRYQFLVNVGVATEGWDDAALDGRGVQVVAMMRPTKSRALYSQCIGRGTRPLPGVTDGAATPDERRDAIQSSAKPHLTVLDFCGNAGRHKLVHLADALGGKSSEEVRDRAEARCMDRAEAEEVDVLELLTTAEREEREQREWHERRGIIAKADYSTQEIDPFSLVALSPDREQAWQTGRPATDRQIAYLQRMKVALPELLTLREASQLIEAMQATPSPAQAAFLAKHGRNPDDYDRRTASDEIDRIKRGGNR